MSIISSVGKNGKNDNVDVKMIQAALSLSNAPSFKLNPKLSVDGKIGKKTTDAILLFQKNIVKLSNPDGRVDPNGKTLSKLRSSITKGLSQEAFSAIMGHGSSSQVQRFFPLLKTAFNRYQLNTPLRISHFLAQIGHESLSLRYTEEIASGSAYEGRKDLGNIQKGDGVRFKGRGLIQLTGRDNYDKYGKSISIDFLKSGNENLIANTPKYALDVSLWFWNSRKLNRYADKDNLNAITRRINGGYNGIKDRQEYLIRAKFFLTP